MFSVLHFYANLFHFRRDMNGARVYFGQHFDDEFLERATRDVRNQGYHDFEAQVVITVTFHRLSPTADSSNGYVSTFAFYGGRTIIRKMLEPK